MAGIDGAVNQNNGYAGFLGVSENGIPTIHVDGGDNYIVNLLVDESLNVGYLLCGIVIGVSKNQLEAVRLTERFLHRLGVRLTPIGLIRFGLRKPNGDEIAGCLGRCRRRLGR